MLYMPRRGIVHIDLGQVKKDFLLNGINPLVGYYWTTIDIIFHHLYFSGTSISFVSKALLKKEIGNISIEQVKNVIIND